MSHGSGRSTLSGAKRRNLPITTAEPIPNNSARLPVPGGRRAADNQWVCFFNGRAGGRAQAVFGTKEQARQFADRHARSTKAREMPLEWEDTNESTTLTTQLGDYVIMPIGDDY
jgi:hypothetical protein